MHVFYGLLCVGYTVLTRPVYDVETDCGHVVGIAFVLRQIKLYVHTSRVFLAVVDRVVACAI
jgi:hypothetical protein